ncbi:hypothetical protein [Rhodococcus gannanensis]|uniref:Signal transduction histidine kinase n=1 Tax=Rhodococcus gannanensis TaxID=1960308 RepID=A0ABW4PAW4_9NOCA
MSPERLRGARDVRALIGMTSPAAKAMVAFYAAACALLAVASRDGVSAFWPICVALVVCVLGAVALIRVPGDPVPLRYSIALAATGPIACGLVLGVLPVPISSPLQIWPLGAITAIYAFMGVRGRTDFAWLGMLATIATCVVWATLTGQGPAYGLAMSIINVAPLLMSTLFAFTIRPAARNIFALREQTTRRAAAEAADSAILEERDRQLRRLDELARPILERIAAGEPLDEQDRLACRLLEAHLRDGVRAPILVDPAVVAAARATRARGIEVVLLDDGGMDAVQPTVRRRFLDSVADALNGSEGGKVTVRVLPPGRAVMATVLCSSPRGDHRTEFGPDGHAVTHSDRPDQDHRAAVQQEGDRTEGDRAASRA